MSTLAVDGFDFTFPMPSCEPATPPTFSFDSSLLDIPYHASHHGHARSSSHGSVYSIMSAASAVSTIESSPDSLPSSRLTTPAPAPSSTRRTSPPIRTHGPLLLPKIRSQDQAIDATACSPPKRARTSPAPAAVMRRSAFRPVQHTRSFTNPEPINFNVSFASQPDDSQVALANGSSLLCSPVSFAQDGSANMHARRASSCSGIDGSTVEKFGFPTYRQLPTYVSAAAASTHSASQTPEPFIFPSYAPREPSPLGLAATPDPTPTSTLMSYLTVANPAPALVRTISFPLRDPHTKHFWWDVRQIRPWTGFDASTVLSLPGAAAMLSCPVPAPVLPTLSFSHRHPETEAALHSIYANYYLPKLNAALALSSTRPITLSVPAKSATATPASAAAGGASDLLFIGNAAGESATAAALFGGKPTARMVGLVRSFDRFNTGMRVEGNIKRVEYLRGLAAIHHAMREHGCRYGFILTEIELVLVRNGTDTTPNFGYLEVTSVQLAAAMPEDAGDVDDDVAEIPLTACLALWGMAMMASDEPAPGQAYWRSEIGAPAEGTRRKALARDDWMPQPQLAEKREAKRARGWVWPEDAVGRKELGKRGVRYGGC